MHTAQAREKSRTLVLCCCRSIYLSTPWINIITNPIKLWKWFSAKVWQLSRWYSWEYTGLSFWEAWTWPTCQSWLSQRSPYFLYMLLSIQAQPRGIGCPFSVALGDPIGAGVWKSNAILPAKQGRHSFIPVTPGSCCH